MKAAGLSPTRNDSDGRAMSMYDDGTMTDLGVPSKYDLEAQRRADKRKEEKLHFREMYENMEKEKKEKECRGPGMWSIIPCSIM